MTDNGLPKDPEGNDSFWCCVARASHSSTAHTEEYVAINLCHVCLCLTSPSLTCQLLPACRRYISPMPPNNIIHSRINKGNNSMNKGKMRCKRGKAAAARRAHIQWWISFFFFSSIHVIKVPVEYLSVQCWSDNRAWFSQTVQTRYCKRAGIKKALWHGTFWHFNS